MRSGMPMTARATAWVFLLALFAPVTALAGYYVQDGKNLNYVDRGDQSQVANVREWQIRLYKNGAATSGDGHWGLITGKSAASVSRQLEKSQEHERQWMRVFKSDYGTLTYFNPLGPIAVLERRPASRDPLEGKVSRLIDTIRNQYNAARTRYEISDAMRGQSNPYRGIGTASREYAENFNSIFQQMRVLDRVLDSALGYNERTLREVEKINQDLDRIGKTAARHQQALASSGGSVLPRESTVRDPSGRDIEQIIEVADKNLEIRRGYRGQDADTAFRVPLADLDPAGTVVRDGPFPGSFVVTLRSNRASVEKTTYPFGRPVVDHLRQLELFFPNRTEAEQFLDALKDM